MKLLVIEDEEKSSEYLKKGLQEHGFSVDVASNGEDGLHLAKRGKYDVIVLDIMLPDRDGWQVLAELRAFGNQTSVLLLTAKDRVEDRVKGLQLGADDYLVKPFAFSELLARIHTVMRRGTPKASLVVTVSDLEIDFVRHRVIRSGKRIDLTAKEFLLLSLLARRAGEVLSRTMIAEQVWDMNFDSNTNVVDVHLSRVRAKIDDPFDCKLIHTIRGVGYVLEDRG